jgi:membrane fusion protein, multidrug efflux system
MTEESAKSGMRPELQSDGPTPGADSIGRHSSAGQSSGYRRRQAHARLGSDAHGGRNYSRTGCALMAQNPIASRLGRSLIAVAAVGCVSILGGCSDAAPAPALVRVAVMEAHTTEFAPTVTLTGAIKAQIETDLSFRVSGKIIERRVDVGDHVTPDEVLARLDPRQEQADLASAKAGVQSAEAQLTEARSDFARQKDLLESGFTTRPVYDRAEQTLRSAQALLDSANAQLASAQDQLGYTVLKADVPGVITARYVETGQVVAQANAVLTLARDAARDAVFDVHETIFAQVGRGPVQVALVSDPGVTAAGEVREVSPGVDAATGTVRVKVALNHLPPQMTLGASVTGSGHLKSRRAILLPSGALFELGGKPAVWVVDPVRSTVSLKPIVVDRYAGRGAAVTGGLNEGELVVTAGLQFLRPGQKVAIAIVSEVHTGGAS